MESWNTVIRCDCGFDARSADEEGLVAEVRRHALEAHGMKLSHQEALLLTLRPELDEKSPATISSEPQARTDEEET
jgi:Protein of unknown function (DUF1059)